MIPRAPDAVRAGWRGAPKPRAGPGAPGTGGAPLADTHPPPVLAPAGGPPGGGPPPPPPRGRGGAAAGGGLTAVLAGGRAPAYPQGATVHWLRWNDFVPASDQLLRREIAQECQRALGLRLNVETINGNDIQARVTSAVQSGTGPD